MAGRRVHPTRIAPLAGAVVALLCLAACHRPAIEGPQILPPPGGFAYDPNARGAGLLPGDHPAVRQRGYFTHADPGSSILITEHAGAVTAAQAEAARAALVGRYPYQEYGLLETLEIDGCPAWGWTVTHIYRGSVTGRGYQAVIACGETAYSVDLHSAEAAFMDPDLQRRTVLSFAVLRSGPDYLQIALGLLLLGGAGAAVQRLRRRRDGAAPPAANAPLKGSAWTAGR